MNHNNPKMYAVVGPTASGKSELAVKIATWVSGAVLSVDSRQIYKGMDIGTGKVPLLPDSTRHNLIYKNIVHYGIDVASPQQPWNVSNFKKYADDIITLLLNKHTTPVLCGGSAQWMNAVIYNQQLPRVTPNQKIRNELEQRTTESLFLELSQKDPQRAKTIDKHNPRRLIRALEIILLSGKPNTPIEYNPRYKTIWIGINPNKKILAERIQTRLKERLDQGLIAEIQKLHTEGISWKQLEDFGLEYRYGALFLQGKLSQEDFFTLLLTSIKQYSKRQLTWWKRNPHIHWVTDPDLITEQTLARLTQDFHTSPQTRPNLP